MKDKEGRESWILEKNAPGATAADRKAAAQAELAAARTVAVVSGQPGGYGLLDFDNNPNSQSDRISKIRYLLEPLGVEVNKWSMGADPEGYTFAEFFSRVGRSQPLQDLRDSLRQQAGTQDFCTFLADRSKTALAQAPYRALVGPACEPPSILDERAILAIQGSNLGLLRKDVKDRGIFAKCTACHFGTFPGAPSLPFGNPAQLEQLLKDTGNGPGGWADRIWSRVSRSPEAVGAMPMGGVALPSDDKVALRAYLRAAGTAP